LTLIKAHLMTKIFALRRRGVGCSFGEELKKRQAVGVNGGELRAELME